MVTDGNISGIVEIINRQDYVRIDGEGCQGHLKTYLHQYDQQAEPGHVFIFSGCLLFNIQNKKKAKKLIECLQTVASKYHFAEFKECKCGDDECNTTHAFRLKIDDLVQDNVFKVGSEERIDSIRATNRQDHQVTYEAGLKRIIEFDKVWLDLYQMLEDNFPHDK